MTRMLIAAVLAVVLAFALASSACSSSAREASEAGEPASSDGGTTSGEDGGADDGGAPADSTSPRSCAEIQGAYAAVLQASLSCDPDAAADPCTLTASTSPGCGCPVKMNAEKTAEREQLSLLTKEYGDAGCDLNACPMSCPLLADYRCQSRGECSAE